MIELKPSQLPIVVWEEKLFAPLVQREFILETESQYKGEVKRDYATHTMPPEYKKRKKYQGMQRRYYRWIGERKITVLTSHSLKTNEKKESYYVWIFMEGENITGKLFSAPILDLPSLFTTTLEYVDAFVDIAEHWPIDPQCGRELKLEFVKGVLHMMKFECHDKTVKHRERRPSFFIFEGPFSKKTVRFLKKKMLPSFRKQLRDKAEGKITQSKRIQRYQRRQEALLQDQTLSVKKDPVTSKGTTTYENAYNDGPHLDD